MKETLPPQERRRYKRLDSIFPVEFQVLDSDGNPCTGWHQAFSQDISKGGICLTINTLTRDEAKILTVHDKSLLLQIHSVFSEHSFLACSDIVWVHKTKEVPFPQYVVGLQFSELTINNLADC